MERCERELRDLVFVFGGRVDLTAMHERAIHECNEHNKATACEERKVLTGSMVESRPVLDKAITNFVKCVTEK